MTYKNFAAVYDELMSNAPYDEWVQFVRKSCERYLPHGRKILDLACGTGTITALLDKDGYDVLGVDLSPDMLAIARNKVPSVPFVKQNMKELALGGTFDLVVIFCDSLNYIVDESGLLQTFTRVHEHLTEGGLLLFDVHSQYKINHLFNGATFSFESPEVAYIWNCFVEEKDCVEHELTFFVKQLNGLYARFDEFHIQKTFPKETYREMLGKAGFELLDMTADFSESKPQATSERIFFVAKKRNL